MQIYGHGLYHYDTVFTGAANQGHHSLLAITATIAPIIEIISAGGEEIGWRGYMITWLLKANIPAPIVTGGTIPG